MEVVSLGLVVLVVVFFELGDKIVPQSQNFVVERLGRFNITLESPHHHSRHRQSPTPTFI